MSAQVIMQTSIGRWGLFSYLTHALQDFERRTGRKAKEIVLPRWRRREWISAVDAQEFRYCMHANDCFFGDIPVHWADHDHIELV